MNITQAAIRNRVVTYVALVVVYLGGMSAYRGLSRAEDPGFIIRTAVVQTTFPGASPERVEQLVTDKLEKVIQEIPELEFVSSQSKPGLSVIYVNILESETEMRPIWDDLRRKVDRAKGELPDGIIGPTVNDEFGDVFGTVISITGEGFSYAELKDVADEVRDELLLIPDAAKVDVFGAQEERVFVEYDNARLAELGMSAFQLKQALEALNIIIPGGQVSSGRERIALEPSGNFASVEQIQRAIINVPGTSDLVFLEDIARVRRDYVDPPESRARAGGEPALVLAISLREGGNITTLGEQVLATLREIEAHYPIGIEFEVQLFQPGEVDKIVSGFVSNLLQAIAIVMAVMLLNLGLRTGLIVASLIPSAMILSLLVMSILGIGLDQMSLAALIIALGMLVDNAIVMSESILVQMREGKSGVQAAIDSAQELRIPLLTSSLTTAAAFLPIALAESAVGEYTAPIFYVVTIALLSSWILALTVIPLLCSQALRVKTAVGEGMDSSLVRGYRRLLLGALRHRALFLVAVILVFAGALYAMGFLPNIFFPSKDVTFFNAQFEFPTGADIDFTDAAVRDIERHMRENLMSTSEDEPGIVKWVSYVGEGGPRFILPYNPEPPNPAYAIMVVNARQRGDFHTIAPEIEKYCLENYPDVKATLRQIENGPPVTHPIEIRVSGRDSDRIFDIVDEVKTQLASIAGTKNIDDDWGARTKKLVVDIDQPRAQRAGISSQDIALSLQTTFSGYELSQYREDDKVIPIVLRSIDADRLDLGRLESLNVYSQLTGQSVPLSQVANARVVWEPSKILRRSRLRTVTVMAEIEPTVTAMEVFQAIGPWLDEESARWGVGYRYEFGGEWEASVKAQSSVMAKLPVAALVILLLLVGQFNSLRKPLIILLTIPLGLIGVVVGLHVAGSYFGFMTFLGVISLSGIVINNAIVLIDRIELEEQQGRPPEHAVVEAAQRRLRPILLTTMTTVGGLIPLWLGGGAMFQPMAIAILFGLLFAAGLTLGVVPVLYSLFYRVSFSNFSEH